MRNKDTATNYAYGMQNIYLVQAVCMCCHSKHFLLLIPFLSPTSRVGLKFTILYKKSILGKPSKFICGKTLEFPTGGRVENLYRTFPKLRLGNTDRGGGGRIF